MNKTMLKILFSLLLVIWVSGCAEIRYLTQASFGQVELLAHRRPIGLVLQAPHVPQELANKLPKVLHYRAFATLTLGLPDNHSYLSYADLGRPFVVWNVFAAPQFSLEAYQWCYWILGCLGYKGYFHEEDARNLARTLEQQGYETYVGGVTAYSTLGWFADPVLNTMINMEPMKLANVIFHELAHQKLFVAGDTEFNESFASAVASLGVQKWLRLYEKQEEIAHFNASEQQHAQVISKVIATKQRLEQIYRSPISLNAKREAKALEFKSLNHALSLLQQSSGKINQTEMAHKYYEFNNARLLAFTSYQIYVDAFIALFNATHGDFPTFYQWAEQIGALPMSQRHSCLYALASTNDYQQVCGISASF